MRIVSWNCNGALRRKTACLDALNADILVIQECEDPREYGSDYRDWAGEFLWIGDLRSKGLGMFVRNGLKLEALAWDGEEYRLFLPARVAEGLTILGVWTQNAKPVSTGYIGQFWRYFEANKFRVGSDAMLIGDFNSNQIWDRARQTGNHSQCVAALDQIDMLSLYHHRMNEPHGSESVATFYMNRKPDRPFHIDYAFLYRDLVENAACQLGIGDAKTWLGVSDHLPLIVDLP